jgi:hypothetical protein
MVSISGSNTESSNSELQIVLCSERITNLLLLVVKTLIRAHDVDGAGIARRSTAGAVDGANEVGETVMEEGGY